MSVTFAAGRFEVTEPELVARYGFPEVMLCHLDGEHEFTLNMSNANAGTVLRALGHEPGDEGWVGSEAPAEFIARIELARVTEPEDVGVPFHELPGEEGRARFFDCGRPEGYVQARLDDLLELADHCQHHGLLVVWA